MNKGISLEVVLEAEKILHIKSWIELPKENY